MKLQGSVNVERKDVNHAIKKHSNKNYSSFDTSPPLEELSITDVDLEISDKSVNMCNDDRKPLLVGARFCVTDEVVSGKTNELNSSLEKEICYDKVLPFPVDKKDLNSAETLGVDNLGYDDDGDDIEDTFSSDKCEEKSGVEKSKSPAITAAATRETIVLCNDLDSVCQVLPLSFSPNLYPDVGSVPLINCQASRKLALPSQLFTSVVTTANTSDSFVTVLSRNKNRVSSAASWPRRRPQSLRVAICYSSPECRQEGVNASLVPSGGLQEIGLSDMSQDSQTIGSLSNNTTSFLKTWGSLENLELDSGSKVVSGLESSFSLSQPDCSKLDDFFQLDHENKQQGLKVLPKRMDNCALTDVDGRSNSSDSSLRSLTSTSHPLSHSAQINTIPSILPHVDSFSPPSYNDYLMSPSSDKENNPALLSVRPKVRQSPRRKKNSPKKKSKSPKKHRVKEELSKPQKQYSSFDLDDVPLHQTKCGSLDDDVWAVDDFLPLPKHNLSQSLPKGMQDFEVCHSPVFGNAAPKSPKLQSDFQKVSPSSSCKDMENSMLISTFSTDTGYETETNKNDSENNFLEKIGMKQKQVSVKLSPKGNGNNQLMETETFNLATPSEVPSEATTPMTVGDDMTEYYSIASEISNIPYSTLQNTGEDTPDYLSICSEMPGGISRLPEDSPSVDLEMNHLFPEDGKFIDLLPSPLESPESCDPSTLTDSPVTMARSLVEDLDDDKSQENCHTEPSRSLTPSPVDSSPNTPDEVPSHELVEVKYVQLSLSIVLAIVLHAMQSISQFMLEIFLATEHEGHWD